MTTYEFYRQTAKILAQTKEDELFDYMIHSMDSNGGFLRSRYCYRKKVLPDVECDEIKTTLLTLSVPFNFERSKEYYEDDNETHPLTTLKMQLFLYDLSNQERFMKKAKWSAAVGFAYPIKINLIEKSYEILPKTVIFKK